MQDGLRLPKNNADVILAVCCSRTLLNPGTPVRPWKRVLGSGGNGGGEVSKEVGSLWRTLHNRNWARVDTYGPLMDVVIVYEMRQAYCASLHNDDSEGRWTAVTPTLGTEE